MSLCSLLLPLPSECNSRFFGHWTWCPGYLGDGFILAHPLHSGPGGSSRFVNSFFFFLVPPCINMVGPYKSPIPEVFSLTYSALWVKLLLRLHCTSAAVSWTPCRRPLNSLSTLQPPTWGTGHRRSLPLVAGERSGSQMPDVPRGHDIPLF